MDASLVKALVNRRLLLAADTWALKSVHALPDDTNELGAAVRLPRVYLGWMPSRTARSRVSAVVQTPALAMPIICMKPPVPKRSHCATMMSSPVFISLACAVV